MYKVVLIMSKILSSKKLLLSGVALSVLLALPTAFAQSNTNINETSTSETIAKDVATKWSVNEPQGEFTTANIDVRSGTWMNVDLSPDGKTIVFDLEKKNYGRGKHFCLWSRKTICVVGRKHNMCVSQCVCPDR